MVHAILFSGVYITMRVIKFTVALAFLLPLAITAENAAAQSDAATSRGSYRVQTRYFNPFNPFNSSRFTMNRFGLPQVRTQAAMGTNPFTANPFSVAAESAKTAPLTASAPAAAEAPSATSEEGVTVVTELLSGRPSYRPPVRSPFRPPPRPAFGP